LSFLLQLVVPSPDYYAFDLVGQALEVPHAADEVEAQASLQDQDHLLELSQGLEQLLLSFDSLEYLWEDKLDVPSLVWVLVKVKPDDS